MKALLRSIIAIAALVGVALTLLNQVTAVSFEPVVTGAYVAGEVLVKFKPVFSAQDRTATVAAQGHAVLANLNQPGWVQVKVGTGQTMTQVLAAYQNDPSVEYAQPNYIYHTTAVPNDTQYGQLWAFKNTGQTVNNSLTQPPSSPIYSTNNPGAPGNDMGIEKAWDHITDCSSVVVAVLDTGVKYDQEDLTANMWNGGSSFPNHGFDFVNNDNDPEDLNGHGTHVAGIIGASGNNSLGATGVCWKASIMAVRVMDTTGSGTTANIIQGINFAVSHGAKVINMSLGGGGGFDSAFSDAITHAQTNDVVIVVAAGNDGVNNDINGNDFFPCNFTQPNLICVAALDQSYALANFSNWGATSVDVGAPGTNILSTWAGSNATISDNFNTGGALNWTTSGGWAYKQLPLSGSTVDVLVDPGTFPSGSYLDNADNRVYKSFDLSGNNVATLNFSTQFSIQTFDFLNLNHRSSGGDPFVGGVQLDHTNGVTDGVVGPLSYDLSACISATCSVGFQLLTNASAHDQGVAILRFSIDTLTFSTTSYNTIDGTSMATPEAAGLATMLRAYNPQYTFADVVNAITKGGRATTSLAGKTTTGKAIDVMSSLAYINPPTGLTATVQ
jgi:subtilisin family serine protease